LSPLLESSRFSTSWSGLESDFSRLDQSAPVNPTTPAFDPSACCRRVRSGVNTLGTGSNPPPVSVSARKPLHLEQENALSARRHKQPRHPLLLGAPRSWLPIECQPTLLCTRILEQYLPCCQDRKGHLAGSRCKPSPKHQPRARRESMSARTRIVARASLRKQHRASIDDSY